jgi:transcriptional regulator GlxA family with amidase domain
MWESNILHMKVGILVYTHCTSSMVSGVADILAFANLQQANGKTTGRKNATSLFEVAVISENGGPVKSFNGLPIIATKSIRSKTVYDLIYIPGFVGNVNDILQREKKLIHWVTNQFKKGAIITAACNGNFLLAESGLLAKKRATTHWSLISEFRNRYMNIILEPEKILIDEGNTISAAGVTAYLNLSVYLVYRFASPELASACAKVFLVDSGRKIQTPYETYLPRKHGDKNILEIQEWLEKNSKQPVSLDAIVQKSNLGRRTLLRKFKSATGDTPLVYLQRIRIENAKRLLEATDSTFSEITWKVGYEDISSFQKLFKSVTGLSPKEYRMKFALI